jgi:hypothetical protein
VLISVVESPGCQGAAGVNAGRLVSTSPALIESPPTYYERPTIMTTSHWDEHLAYEVRELCSDLDLLHPIWPAMHGATPANLEEGTAFFEAALVHARNLLELLVRGPVANDDALTPEDFGIPAWSYAEAAERFEASLEESVEESYARICTYVSHLSRNREPGVPYWELQPLVDQLLEEAGRFVDDAESRGTELPQTRDSLLSCAEDSEP